MLIYVFNFALLIGVTIFLALRKEISLKIMTPIIIATIVNIIIMPIQYHQLKEKQAKLSQEKYTAPKVQETQQGS